MGPGGCVLVQSGAHKDLYGKVESQRIHDVNIETLLPNTLSRRVCRSLQIEGIDADNARVMVKLAIGGKTVTISQYAVKLVFRKEYEKNSKDLSE